MSHRRSGKNSQSNRWIYKKRYIALVVIVISTIIFGALNNEWILGQIRYSNPPARQPVTNFVAESPVKPDPSAPTEIIIPRLQVTAPVVTDQPSKIESNVQLSLRKGVLLYGESARPGQIGNTVIVGHSSGPAWAPGDYKWIFTFIDKLKAGDKIVVRYQAITYTYTVTDSRVVGANDVTILSQSKLPILSLVTCTPVGTSKNRLVVHASLDNPATLAAQ